MSRRGFVAGVVGAAALLGVAGLAFACTTFSMLNLSATSGVPGTEVVVKGEGAAPNAPVLLRWNARNAPVMAQATTDAQGAFAVPVKVPEGRLGVHVLLATDGDGVMARAAFEAVGATGERADGEPAFRFDALPAQSTNWLQVGVNILGFGLLAAIPVLGLAVLRRRPVPVAAGSLPAEG